MPPSAPAVAVAAAEWEEAAVMMVVGAVILGLIDDCTRTSKLIRIQINQHNTYMTARSSVHPESRAATSREREAKRYAQAPGVVEIMQRRQSSLLSSLLIREVPGRYRYRYFVSVLRVGQIDTGRSEQASMHASHGDGCCYFFEFLSF